MLAYAGLCFILSIVVEFDHFKKEAGLHMFVYRTPNVSKSCNERKILDEYWSFQRIRYV